MMTLQKGKEDFEVYDLQGNFIGRQRRDIFYQDARKEFAETGKITKKVKTMRLLLMNSDGRLYIQKRSKLKRENPGLYDKTVGGHVRAGHSFYLTVIQECHQELGFPAVVLPDEEFESAIKVVDLSIIGIFRRVDHINNYISVRKSADGDFKQPYICSFYVGYYDGSIRFCDGESTGIEVFTLEELERRIQEAPSAFAEDLTFMLRRYREHLVPIKKEEEFVLGFEE